MTAFSRQNINHEMSLFQTLTPFSLYFDPHDSFFLSCEAIMLNFIFLKYLYNMHKTLFGGGYLICNIKFTISVSYTMTVEKKI